MGRVVQEWIARPFHPELDRHLRAGFLALIANLRGKPTSLEKKLARVPAVRGERGAKASADGARRAKSGASPRTWGNTGGGGSDMIQFVRRPGVSDETRGGLDTVSHLTPGGPQADLETTNREGLQNH